MDSDLVGVVYLLHYEQPLEPTGNQHYMGWTVDLPTRIESHRSGPRERCVFTYEAAQRGLSFVVARVWEGETILKEKALKRLRNHRRLCPICNPTQAEHLYVHVDES